jgi:FkbM family methyltransferase
MGMIAERTLRPLKECVSRYLRGVGLYQRAKASWLYDFYWILADRRLIDDRRKETDFYRAVLDGFPDGSLIFDIGANHGYKTGIFLRLGAKVIAVEPDEISRRTLEQQYLKYRLKKQRLVVVPKAVSDKGSVERMWIDAPGSAKNTLSRKWVEMLRSDDTRFGQRLKFGHWKQVETLTIEQLITTHGLPLFVKIDVEGHELKVLRALRRTVPYLSFEVNLPEFKPEGLKCVQLLAKLAPDGKFNYTPDCRHGLVLKQWLEGHEFLAVLTSCSDESIEVFWKTSVFPTGKDSMGLSR